MSSQKIKMMSPVVVLLLFWFIPLPEGLTKEAWHFMAIFMAVVIGLIVEPVPAALVGFAGVSLVAILGLMGSAGNNIKWALSGFSNSVIWLIFAAFMFALGTKRQALVKESHW